MKKDYEVRPEITRGSLQFAPMNCHFLVKLAKMKDMSFLSAKGRNRLKSV